MGRITDSERGARLALSMAEDLGQQPDLYDDGLSPEFWDGIAEAASLQLRDEAALRAALVPAGDEWGR